MNTQPQILISTSSFGKIDRQPLDLLEKHGIQYQLNPHGRKLQAQETLALLSDKDGVIAGTEQYSRDVLRQLPDLKIISRCGTGTDSIDLTAAAELGVQIRNTPDAHVDAVAELTLAGMLDLLRYLTSSDRQLRQGIWQKRFGRLLRGKDIGIIGLGRIGKALVQLLQPFAVRVRAYDPYPDAEFAADYQVKYVTLSELLASSDIVTLHLPYTTANHYLLDADRLSQMQTGAILLNCARGNIVDEVALYDNLQSGHLAGAYLDTFAQEPYTGSLTKLDNVLLSPHIGSYAAESRLRMELEAVENLLSFYQM